jgi:hypothetical protein
MSKKHNFINKFVHKVILRIKQFFTSIDLFHRKKVLEARLDPENNLNPYQMFLVWSLETIGYGIILSVPYNLIFGWQGWMNCLVIPSLGILKWFLYDFISEIKKK